MRLEILIHFSSSKVRELKSSIKIDTLQICWSLCCGRNPLKTTKVIIWSFTQNETIDESMVFNWVVLTSPTPSLVPLITLEGTKNLKVGPRVLQGRQAERIHLVFFLPSRGGAHGEKSRYIWIATCPLLKQDPTEWLPVLLTCTPRKWSTFSDHRAACVCQILRNYLLKSIPSHIVVPP